MPHTRGALEIAVGWTVVRVEQHNTNDLSIGYIYLCPDDQLYTRPKQASLDLQKKDCGPSTHPPEKS
jgi:hypothetical protein